MAIEFKASDWYDIPAGTPPAECKACRTTIFFVPGRTKGTAPIDTDAPGAYEPTSTEIGRGTNHFKSCTDANRFHRGAR